MKQKILYLLFAFSSFANASIINVDFNSPDTLDAFNVNTANWRGDVEYRSTGGVGGSGGVGGFSADTTYKAKSFDFSKKGTQITVSAFYKMAAKLEPKPGLIYGFSEFTLVPEPNSFIYEDNVLFANVGQTSDSVQMFGGALQKDGGVFDGFMGENPTGIILANRWYQFGVTFTNLGGAIGYQFNVTDFGLDGTAMISEVMNASFQTPDTHNIGKDKSVYAGVQVIASVPFGYDYGGSVAMDNFSIAYIQGENQVPTPSSITLFLVVLVAMLKRVRLSPH